MAFPQKRTLVHRALRRLKPVICQLRQDESSIRDAFAGWKKCFLLMSTPVSRQPSSSEIFVEYHLGPIEEEPKRSSLP